MAARDTQLIVVAQPGAALARLERPVAAAGARMRPVFAETGERLRRDHRIGDLSQYYRVHGRPRSLETLIRRLRKLDLITAAFGTSGIGLPAVPPHMKARKDPPPAVTPDFSRFQRYLERAPVGIDARYAWSIPGGRGAGVKIVDIEGGWRFSQEDLQQHQGGIVGGHALRDEGWVSHGTAVAGVIGGDRTDFGVTGICPEAMVFGVSAFDSLARHDTADAIRLAAARLSAGDLLLIELHKGGPREREDPRLSGAPGAIPIEWWPHNFEAIQAATSRGIIVVEAAGNGHENLDDPVYDRPPKRSFARDGWKNPFNPSHGHDSGAIIVGAGAPPPGINDWDPDPLRPDGDYGPAGSRLDFSNHGRRVDVQAWGKAVTTCGYGTLQGGRHTKTRWYTGRFGGTSSAAAIVAGVLACLQGIRRERGQPPLTPRAARRLLRQVGVPQSSGPRAPVDQRIGRLPDLRRLIAAMADP
ncbi:MAG TPA: S8 family peptidase [Methylomirabilota bacterium]|nr:S8 family peptidase [Methylomirabilota bacterium]